jgi:hypothetical protein
LTPSVSTAQGRCPGAVRLARRAARWVPDVSHRTGSNGPLAAGLARHRDDVATSKRSTPSAAQAPGRTSNQTPMRVTTRPATSNTPMRYN